MVGIKYQEGGQTEREWLDEPVGIVSMTWCNRVKQTKNQEPTGQADSCPYYVMDKLKHATALQLGRIINTTISILQSS